jgi:hypothetical protein
MEKHKFNQKVEQKQRKWLILLGIGLTAEEKELNAEGA